MDIFFVLYYTKLALLWLSQPTGCCTMNQGQLFLARHCFHCRFSLQSQAVVFQLLLIHQLQWTSASGILCPCTTAMDCQPPLHVGGDAGIERPISASQNVQIPERSHILTRHGAFLAGYSSPATGQAGRMLHFPKSAALPACRAPYRKTPPANAPCLRGASESNTSEKQLH